MMMQGASTQVSGKGRYRLHTEGKVAGIGIGYTLKAQ